MVFKKIMSKFKKPIKLKEYLRITQKGNQLYIKGKFSKQEYIAAELKLIDREGNNQMIIPVEKPGSTFLFKVNLQLLLNKLKDSYQDTSEVLDWYIRIEAPKSIFSEGNLEKRKEVLKEFIHNGVEYVSYSIRLGRFQETYIGQLDFYDSEAKSLINYVTTKGNLSIAYKIEPNAPTKIQIEGMKRNRNGFDIQGRMFTRNSIILNGKAVLVPRGNIIEPIEYDLNLTRLKNESVEKYGLNRYLFQINLNVYSKDGVLNIGEDIYDMYLKLILHDQNEVKYVRVGRPTITTRMSTSAVMANDNKIGQVIHPYYTFKQKNLSFEVTNFPIDNYKYLRKVMRWSWLLKIIYSRKNIWLVGERSYKAQDTGYYFFKYMRTKHREKNVFYVIDEQSPEMRNVATLGNVINFGSKKHILYTILAKKVIASHHPDYLYPIRTKKFKRKVHAKKVFLQHGVMGTKNMTMNYGKNTSHFDTDLFLVSSTFEKDMIVNDFRYTEDEVKVTGLSRFDSLFEANVKLKRQVLIIPTWRDWLGTRNDFLESDYYKKYKRLLEDSQLHEWSKANNLSILFCLHPNMQHFSDLFYNENITIIKQGEIDVQQLIKESMLMITDYSSVAFDFSFLMKPVIYYQFDRERFIGGKPSHLDLDVDLPGDIVFSHESLLESLQQVAQDNFQMRDVYKNKAKKFITYRDRNSSERIYDEIVKYKKTPKTMLDNILNHYLLVGVFNRFRRSSYYFPIMKKLYNIMKVVIPINKNLIVFESGLGKQYGDSPKYIYEELVKRDTDNKYSYIWVNNLQWTRFTNKNTKKVKRLSPAYYYYLAKAGYWVNNQNFPTYLNKPKQTTYLQTWHGTPLKKMLNDIEEVHGRDENYLTNVSKAVQDWDYLISPSSYATAAFRSAFAYKDEVLELGYPRNDLFYKEDSKVKARDLKKKLGIPKGKKVILYAPTFRDNQKSANKFTFDLNLDLKMLKEQLEDDYVLLLKMHVVISKNLDIPEECQNFARNVSNYPEIQELLLITDILITDYSSVMFDFCNTGRPILFYTYDLKEYRDRLRGFYFDFEQNAPGPFLESTGDVVNAIVNIDAISKKYEDAYNTFYNKFCYLEDGHASERVVNYLFGKELEG